MAEVYAQKVSVGEIISNGISNGLKSFVPLFVAGLLYLLTIWIPYLNIGTTIGMWHMIARIGRGEKVSPTDIFDDRYRTNIGEFFLLLALNAAGAIAGFILPGAGYIIGLSWILSIPLFVDRGTDPMESLKLSNKLTYGNKLAIFFGLIILYLGIYLAGLIFFFVLPDFLAYLLIFILVLLAMPIMFGAIAYIYAKLTSGIDSEMGDQGYADVVPEL